MPLPFTPNFGTFGAVIRTLMPIPSRKALFDIGAAGPIAGFIVATGFLIYGFETLPGIEYLYQIHPEYLTNGGLIPTNSLHFGDTLYYYILSKIFANPHGFLPPMNEIYHYPFLCAGWFGIFVTALNMLPLGQLDGGHIVYSMYGKLQYKIAKFFWWIMFSIGLSSILKYLFDFFKEDYPFAIYDTLKSILYPILLWIKINYPILMSGWEGWILWAVITRFFIKLNHPEIEDATELDPKRKMVGWVAILLLLLSFSLNGIFILE